MTPEAFLKNFGVIAEAPGGVGKLRELILELAIRGALVAQDPQDVAVQVPRQGEQQYPENTGLPMGWQTACLGAVVLAFQNGVSKRKGDEGKPIPVLRLADIVRGQLRESSLREINLTDQEIAKYRVLPGDILVIRVNGSDELVGRFIPCKSSRTWAYSDHLIRIRLSPQIMDAGYLCICANSVTARKHLVSKAITTAGQKTINQSALATLVLNVPPVAEQKRIVAKVDQLMALCDELEHQQAKKQETGTRFTQSALEALANAGSPEEFGKGWRRIVDNFEQFFDRDERIWELRKAILGLALRGRLVSHEHTEEDAAMLLRRIAQTPGRARSEQSREITEARGDEQNRHSLPRTWEWAPVGSIASCVLGKMLDKSKHTKGRLLPYLRNINVRWGGFDLSDLLSMYFEDDELERYGVRAGDVLICEGGEPGRAAVWRDPVDTMLIQKAIHRVRLEGDIVPEWLVMNLRYDALTGRLARHFTGATIKHFTGQSLARYQIRLAPIVEQKRIVAKVDQLMVLCNELESRLRDADQGVQRLAEAMAAEMVA